MPRNAQGLYTLPAGNPVTPGTIIESVWANDTMSDLADAMTQSLPRNGAAPMTGGLILANSTPTQAREAASKAYVDQFMAYSSGMPIGAVSAFGGSVAPAGWLLCNGAAVSRTTYADLFALVGTTYGAGDSSTTFNLPDLRSEFIRGRDATRAIGSKQAASFASHTHVVSDPGHTHTQAAHSHSVSTVAHSHGVSDPGHAHSIPVGATQGGWEANSGTGFRPVAPTNTGAAGTGISIQSASPTGTAAAVTPVINSATTGETVGAAGGTETVPQNMALDYYIKALHDAAGVTSITSIDTSDSQMISVDATNVAVPVLDIHSNVAFGTVKLDAGGKIPLNQMPTTSQQFLGYFDASGGQNPSEKYPTQTFFGGDTYVVSVNGSITVFDPVTLVASLTPVTVGNLLQYVTGSVSNPTGWYYAVASTTVIASQVGFTPAGGITSMDVQAALVEVQGNIPTTASQIAFAPAGTIAATNTQAAIAELDSETQTALGLKSNTATTVTKDSATGAANLPAGAQIQRPAVPTQGMLRFNTDSSGFEGFNGTNWGAVGGGATGAPGNPFIYENDIIVTANYSVTSGKNAMSAGPITVYNGVTVTVPPGSVWTVV